jgi:hypothetical protein
MSTHQFPALFGNLVHSRHRFHENIVSNTSFWNPDRTQQVRPIACDSLLECATFVRTEDARLDDGYVSREHQLATSSLVQLDFRVRPYTCGRATVLPVYTVRHSSLVDNAS